MYECPGAMLDRILNLFKEFDKTIPKVSSRVKQLSRIWHNINPYSSERIYEDIILKIMLCCSNIFVGMLA